MKRQLIYSILVCFACIASAEEIVTWQLIDADKLHAIEDGIYTIVTGNDYKSITEVVDGGYATLTNEGFVFDNNITSSSPDGTMEFDIIRISVNTNNYFQIKKHLSTNSYLGGSNGYLRLDNFSTDSYYWIASGNFLQWSKNEDNKSYYLSTGSNAIQFATVKITANIVRLVKKNVVGYTRAKGNANMGTICLPYAVKSADIAGCTCYEVVGKVGADTISGQKLYFQSVDSMIAGMPYIYVVDDTASMVKFTYSGQAVATTQHKNGLYGTFAAITDDNTLTGKYLLTLSNSQVVFACCATGSSLGANKAYLDLESVPQLNSAPSAVLGRRLLTLGTPNSMGPTTLLDEMSRVAPVEKSEKIMVNGQLIIRKGKKSYDIYGREIKEKDYE